MLKSHSKLAFVGLGNPGKKYAKMRHNLGFMVVEQFSYEQGWIFREDRVFNAKVVKGHVGECEVHLILPQTYMNECGKAVSQYFHYHRLTASQAVVVCDDTALQFGHLRLREKGSAGGHNGLKSLIVNLGTNQFARLRMGIGKSGNPHESLADYVLSNFAGEEAIHLAEFVGRGAAVLNALTTESIANVMSRVNRP